MSRNPSSCLRAMQAAQQGIQTSHQKGPEEKELNGKVREKEEGATCANTFTLLSHFLFLLPHNCWGGHQRASLFKTLRYNCIKAKISSGNRKHSIVYNTAMLTYFFIKNMTTQFLIHICIYTLHVYVFLWYTHICIHYLQIYSMYTTYIFLQKYRTL